MKKIVVLLALTLATWPAGAAQRLRVSATPPQSFAPATVRVRVTLTPDARNRVLVIEADSDEFFSSSEISLNGVEAPRIVETRLPSLPAGDYVVKAIVIDSSGDAAAFAQQSVRVIG